MTTLAPGMQVVVTKPKHSPVGWTPDMDALDGTVVTVTRVFNTDTVLVTGDWAVSKSILTPVADLMGKIETLTLRLQRLQARYDELAHECDELRHA